MVASLSAKLQRLFELCRVVHRASNLRPRLRKEQKETVQATPNRWIGGSDLELNLWLTDSAPIEAELWLLLSRGSMNFTREINMVLSCLVSWSVSERTDPVGWFSNGRVAREYLEYLR